MLGSSVEFNFAFGKAVRRRRKELGLSQEQLAFMAGVQRNYVSLIELGRSQPTVALAHSVSLALDLRLSELIRGAEDGS
jgi:transcriptional regulator with XRE-family HTH domain